MISSSNGMLSKSSIYEQYRTNSRINIISVSMLLIFETFSLTSANSLFDYSGNLTDYIIIGEFVLNLGYSLV